MDEIAFSGHIDLEGKGIGDEGCVELVKRVIKAIENGSHIKSIRLSKNNIGDDGAYHLARLLEYPILLHLSHNNLTNVGLDILDMPMETRAKMGLPYGNFYYGFNPGIKRPSLLETWFPGKAKIH